MISGVAGVVFFFVVWMNSGKIPLKNPYTLFCFKGDVGFLLLIKI